MDDCKFQLGQIIYSANSSLINRYMFIEIITKETVDGITKEYTLQDPTGRKVMCKEENFDVMFADIEEARTLCKQNWEIESKNVVKQLDTISDKVFDEIAEEIKIKREKAEQGK